MNLFSLIAGLASILGLLFSVAALIQASRASSAAREARDRIVVRTLAEEVEVVCNRIDHLLDLIEHDRFDEAASRAHEIASILSEIPFRRDPYLTEDRKNQLLNAREQLRTAGGVMSGNRRQPLSPTQRERVIRVCRSTTMTLREILGTIKGQLDRGGKA